MSKNPTDDAEKSPDVGGSSDDDMSPQEREKWLRERGVLIETTEDRRRVDAALAGAGGSRRPPTVAEQVQRLSLADSKGENTEDKDGGDGEEGGIKFVHIPHDTSKPLRTVLLPSSLAAALGPSGDLLPTYIKSYFADGVSIDQKLMQDQASRHFAGGDGGLLSKLGPVDEGGAEGEEKDQGKKLQTITTSAIAKATQSGSVETFPLVRPSSTNSREGVYVYIDEVGLLKHLPHNQRASQLGARCGYHPPPNFVGDVFIGRIRSAPGGGSMRNVDIDANDVRDASAEWVVRAPAENEAYQRAMNDATGRTGELQPAHAGTEGAPAAASDAATGCEYTWLQNDDEVELTVPLGIDAGVGVDKKAVDVRYRPRSVRIHYQKKLRAEVELYSTVDVDGCTWTLDRAGKSPAVVITCEKASAGEIWPRLELN